MDCCCCCCCCCWPLLFLLSVALALLLPAAALVLLELDQAQALVVHRVAVLAEEGRDAREEDLVQLRIQQELRDALLHAVVAAGERDAQAQRREEHLFREGRGAADELEDDKAGAEGVQLELHLLALLHAPRPLDDPHQEVDGHDARRVVVAAPVVELVLVVLVVLLDVVPEADSEGGGV